MAFPVLFDTFVEKVKQDSESSAVELEDLYLVMSMKAQKIRGINPEVDEAIDVVLSVMADTCNTSREWSNRLNSFSVLSRSRVDVEDESVVKLVKECEHLRDLVEENIKSIAASKVMKRQADVDLSERDAALTRQYINDGYKLTNDTLEKFELTYQGARLRLIEAGVWRVNKK